VALSKATSIGPLLFGEKKGPGNDGLAAVETMAEPLPIVRK